MNQCWECSRQTNSDFVIGESIILCTECAGKYIDVEINKLSEEINKSIERKTFLNKEKTRLKQLDCEHLWRESGYGTNEYSINYCAKCDLVKYVPWKEGD